MRRSALLLLTLCASSIASLVHCGSDGESPSIPAVDASPDDATSNADATSADGNGDDAAVDAAQEDATMDAQGDGPSDAPVDALDAGDASDTSDGNVVDGNVADVADAASDVIDAGIDGAAPESKCNGLDDDKDGVVDDGCPCVVGSSGASCYTGLVSTRGVGACTDGKLACVAINDGGSSEYDGCSAQVVPTTEDVGGSDLDCDGFASPATPLDFDVGADGSYAVVSRIGNFGATPQRIGVTCFGANGRSAGAAQLFELADTNVSWMPKIARAWNSNISAMLVNARKSSDPATYNAYLRIVDASCSVLGSVTIANDIDYFDVAVDDAGNAYVTLGTASGVELRSYTSAGALRWSKVAGTLTGSLTMGKHVRVVSATGNGVVTMQSFDGSDAPIYYRRFASDGSFTDNAPVLVPGSDNGHNTTFDGHVLGVNESGSFAISWADRSENPTATRIRAAIFGSNGVSTGSADLGTVARTSGHTEAYVRRVRYYDGNWYVPYGPLYPEADTLISISPAGAKGNTVSDPSRRLGSFGVAANGTEYWLDGAKKAVIANGFSLP